MLAPIQMARLTCAALLERHGRRVTSADWQRLIPGREKAGRIKGLKLPGSSNLNDYRRNHHTPENSHV